MHKGFFTDLMQHRPALFTTMLAFNGFHTNALHDGEAFAAEQNMATTACMQALSGIQGLDQTSLATLAASPIVQRHMQAAGNIAHADFFAQTSPDSAPHSHSLEPDLSLHPLASPNLLNPLDSPQSFDTPQYIPTHIGPFWDFAEESRRLVFLSHEELTVLVRLFGVALHARYYAHLVSHADVVALRRALGAEAYAYGLVRGRFQLGSIAKIFKARSQGIGNTGQNPNVDEILQNIRRDGDIALALCMASWPQALQERLCILLRRPIHPIDADDATVRGVWFALKKLLLREVAPQWAPCFD